MQILRPRKTGSLLVIVLSCPLIGSLSSSTANQRAAQNNYYAEPDFGVPGFVLLKLCYLYHKMHWIQIKKGLSSMTIVFLEAYCTNLLMVLPENVVLIQFSGSLLAKYLIHFR